ncbi:MAG TPA: polyprenyl synthetase family protein [Propionibacteriaceae bacterium]|nr:polyprenyl synthetase family protein [Propionibacteriaceae bacterium]HPZ50374.1 polyprenyl synthetase family protein [Propionibacteriaceae bacterium]HQE32205.1 polyprenyl synthetase family protein [Propionibacteriaceae bacterium]
MASEHESDEELRRWGAALLETVEERLLQAASANTPFVTEVARHITAAGGKRFRPMLVLLASALAPAPDEDAAVRASLVVELTHAASLYHDDVMDEAELRRGAPSANARWQNSVAIMVGDLLFSRASSIVATLGVEYVAIQAETFARLVQGQIAELVGPADDADPLDHHLAVVADKTGSLIATSARFGGMVAGVDEPQLEALTRFGEEIGVVFQLSDDLIDITSEATGKTPGTDLREGVSTLATLMVTRSTDPADAELRDLVSRPLDESEVDRALELLRSHRVLADARTEIARRAEVARSYLAPLPEGAAKRALLELCDAVVTRSA